MKHTLSPQERRKAWLYAAAIVAGLFLLIGAGLWIPTWSLWQPRADIPPENAALTTSSQGLDAIAIDATFDPDNRRINARQVMTLVNRSGQTLTEVTLRSYSGAYLSADTSPAATEELFAACYGTTFTSGGLIMEGAQLNHVDAAYAWADDAHTVLILPTQQDWFPGESITVTLDYHVNIPLCQSRFGLHDGIWALGNVFPTAAVWLDGELRTDAYISIGDPFLSECANWMVNLTLPEGYTVAATGYAESPVSSAQGMSTYRFEASAVRDFALVISDRWQSASRMAGDVAVIAHARSKQDADVMAEIAARALRVYESRYGAYLYPTLTLCEVDFPFGGMEYPRLVMIASDLMDSADSLEYTIAHETAHQWWSVMVGSDGWYQPWQDEALCEYAAIDYIGDTYGQAAREDMIFQRIETAMRITIPEGITPGSPIDYFADLGEYGVVVYQRGAALLTALENLLGKDTLDDFLRTYAETYRLRIVTRKDMEALLTTATGQDLSALFLDYLDTAISN